MLNSRNAYQDRNVILANTYEHRFPNSSAIQAAVSDSETVSDAEHGTVKVNMTSRLVGLVVIPGQYITRIELEESLDQPRASEGKDLAAR
jgi:N-alpha-acetyltransferase 38, NatC auxiliary subunit